MAVSHARISTHGAIFTGQATRELRRTLDAAKADVAKQGVNLIQARLGSVLKNPTGFYRSQITTKQLGKFNDQLIHDGGVVYGPWLETGEYSPPRRFKGYKTFRRTRTRLRKIANQLAQRRIDRLVARWNA